MGGTTHPLILEPCDEQGLIAGFHYALLFNKVQACWSNGLIAVRQGMLARFRQKEIVTTLKSQLPILGGIRHQICEGSYAYTRFRFHDLSLFADATSAR